MLRSWTPAYAGISGKAGARNARKESVDRRDNRKRNDSILWMAMPGHDDGLKTR
jgi:hypothetical protein